MVAIGASAGGIEAISTLLENISPKLGMAYVIIQHLAPDHESILPELLERKTKMPVHARKDISLECELTVTICNNHTCDKHPEKRIKLLHPGCRK